MEETYGKLTNILKGKVTRETWTMIWEHKQSTVSENIIHMSEDGKERWKSSTYETIGRLEIIRKESCFKLLEIVDNFPGGSDSKVSAYNAGNPGSIPGLGRYAGEGNGNPLQHSCLENSMNGGAWQVTVHGVTKNWTLLSDFTLSE